MQPLSRSQRAARPWALKCGLSEEEARKEAQLWWEELEGRTWKVGRRFEFYTREIALAAV